MSEQETAGQGSGAWLWGPFATSAAIAGMGAFLARVSGGAALAIAALVLITPAVVMGAAHVLGRPILGSDHGEQVWYLGGVLAALAAWLTAAGVPAWAVATVDASAVVGLAAGWYAYGPRKLVLSIAASIGAAAAVLAGAALNPFADPSWPRWAAAWAGGTALGALPWWTRRRGRRQAEDATANAAAETAAKVEKLIAALVKHTRKPITVVTVEVGEHGRHAVRVKVGDGGTVQTVAAAIVAVESELGLRAGAIMCAGDKRRRDEVVVTVVPEEPKAEAHDMPPLPTSITQPAPLGRHDTGEPMAISIYEATGARTMLVGGEKGSGKSRGFWTLMKSWTACDDVVIIMGDRSGGATSEPWMPCLLWRETTNDGVNLQIEALLAVATARAASLPGRGWESWQPSRTKPAIIFAIDEAQSVLKNDWAARTQLEQLIQVDRKSGISVVLMCPNPVVMEGISPTIREQSRIRACYRSSGDAVKWALAGTPSIQAGHVVGEFDKPGQLLVSAPGVIATVPGRTYDTRLAEAKAEAVLNARRRPALDQLTAAAMRKVAGNRWEATAEQETRPAEERWTPADEEAVRVEAQNDEALKAHLRQMAEGPGVLGKAWAPMPEVPAIPEGRLSTEQALHVAAAMVAQPGGTTPADVQRATRRSRSWVFDVLAKWVEQGAAEQPEQGRYVAGVARLPLPDDRP